MSDTRPSLREFVRRIVAPHLSEGRGFATVPSDEEWMRLKGALWQAMCDDVVEDEE